MKLYKMALKVYREKDFIPGKIQILDKSCNIILFHVSNRESLDILDIWDRVSKEVGSVGLGRCDLIYEEEIMKRFRDLKSDKTDPLYDFALNTVPFILTYRNGNPVAFYNGAVTVQNLIDYVMILACENDYFEKSVITSGMAVDDGKNLGLKAVSSIDRTVYTKSSDLIVEKPSRIYTPGVDVIRTEGGASAK